RGIRDLIQGQADLPFDVGTVEDLLIAPLLRRLMQILRRTMILELNVARLQGLLHGHTPEERFRSFIERLEDHDTAPAPLQEYPVLARQLVIAVDQWADFSLEFLQNLCSDWDAIRVTFSADDAPGDLVQVIGNAGDNHRNGRSVQIAGFQSGLRLVYKPRSM